MRFFPILRAVAAVFLGAACLFPAVVGTAADPAAPELERQVRQWVRQLDAKELKARDQAEAELLKLGARVLPLLPAPSERKTAEVRQRLERIRQTLERERDEAFAAGSKVNLTGPFKLSAALAEIEKQTGNKIIDYREEFGQEADDPELKLELSETPFWQALDQILDQASLTVYPFADQQGIALVARTDSQGARCGRAAYLGAFRLQATKLVAERSLVNPDLRSLDLTLDVQWEPKLAPIALLESMDEIEAQDDRGQPVLVEVREAQLETPINAGTTTAELHVPLVPPERAAKRIATLKGKMTALLPGGVETFEFRDLEKAKQVEQRRGGAVVTLEQVRKNNALWEVRMVIRFDDNAGALESHRGWVFNNEAFLQGSDGKSIKPDGYETTRQSENEVGVAYLFDVPDLTGKSFVYRSPTVVLRLPFEYELKDLDLP